MKNNTGLEEMIQKLVIDKNKAWKLIHDYPVGGYAKHEPPLLQFMNEFYRQTGIPSDFVYTGKLFYAIADLAEKKYFPAGSRILLIHSGGLQGNESLSAGSLIF
jgi:1-aminocyclopropane-1-carboxylate deaminase